MDDATLVSRAVGGDRDAFAAIYDRDTGAVLDLCTAVLRDADEAAEATLDSFLRAARELVNLRDRSRLRLWLLAVARHEATARAQRRRQAGRAVPAGGTPAVAAYGSSSRSPAGGSAGTPPAEGSPTDGSQVGSPDGAADGALGGVDPGRLDWDPSEALPEPDRAVLHLHLRHQLDADDLGTVLGLRPAAATARAQRLRQQAETSVGALLLLRADGGADPFSCPGLTLALDGWDGRFTPDVSGRVDRHARACAACRARRTGLLGRLRAMASLPFLPPPPWLRREVLIRMELAVSPKPLPGWEETGFPPGIGGPARWPRPWVRRVATAAAVVVLAGGAFLVLRHDSGPATLTAAGSASSSAPTTVPTTLGGPATSGVTAALTAPTSTGVTSPSTSAAPAAPGPTAPDPVPTVPVPPVVVDREPPAISFGADVASAYIAGCPYSVVGVWADVADQSPVTWVALFVRSPAGVEDTVVMAPDGRGWRATMGEFANPGQAVFWVEAVDSEGNRGRGADQALDVFQCA